MHSIVVHKGELAILNPLSNLVKKTTKLIKNNYSPAGGIQKIPNDLRNSVAQEPRITDYADNPRNGLKLESLTNALK